MTDDSVEKYDDSLFATVSMIVAGLVIAVLAIFLFGWYIGKNREQHVHVLHVAYYDENAKHNVSLSLSVCANDDMFVYPKSLATQGIQFSSVESDEETMSEEVTTRTCSEKKP